MKFNKKTNGSYHAADTVYITELIDLKSLTPKGLIDLQERIRDNPKVHIGEMGGGFATTSQEIEPSATDALPFGTYDLRSDRYGRSFLQPVPTKEASNYVSLNLLEDVEKDMQMFLSKRDVYERLQTPYRRGYLFHGPPGNGKTAMIRELVNKYKDKAYIINATYVPSLEISDLLSEVPGLKIFIFEEVASNDNIHPASLLTFMDGEHSVNDCIVIATTNEAHLLKANIANRPSRFDLVTKIGNPKFEDAVKILSRYIGYDVVDTNWLKEGELSIAQLKEIALVSALTECDLHTSYKRIKSQFEAFNGGFEDKKSFGLSES